MNAAIAQVKDGIDTLVEVLTSDLSTTHDDYTIEYSVVDQRFKVHSYKGMFVSNLENGSGFSTYPDEELVHVHAAIEAVRATRV
jgi:hypothetical protein